MRRLNWLKVFQPGKLKSILLNLKIQQMANYFNSLPLRLQLEQLGKCDFMDESEFANGVEKLKGKQIQIIDWNR